MWLRSLNNKGYGKFATSRGGWVLAHRVAWAIAYGEIPDGLCVLHKCDNRRCVNAKHLFLGTKGDNARDRDAKGRTWIGEQQTQAKLTDRAVREIRRRSNIPGAKAAMAREFGVSTAAIANVVSGRNWTHVR